MERHVPEPSHARISDFNFKVIYSSHLKPNKRRATALTDCAVDFNERTFYFTPRLVEPCIACFFAFNTRATS